MDFAVLGPIEVRDEQVDVTPAAAMPRRVLATLLLHADQVVPIPTLIEELWEDDPPRLARKTVQTYVYQLRKALGGGPTGPVRQLLETRPQGYRILLEPGELDSRLFEQRARAGRDALASGDATGAAATLREALALWRGDALMDLLPGPVLAAQAGRLEDSRRGVLEQRIEADLRLGHHRDLVGELKSLMIRYPAHEEFCAQLMRAAYRSGQRDEALSAYDRLRRAVVEHTGLEPSERLRRLQHDVLVDSPSLGRPAEAPREASAIPAELPAAPEVLVGRAHDLARVGASVRRRPDAASPGLAVLCGPPGAGKTAIALYAGHRLRERFPDGQLYASLHTEAGVPVNPLTVLQSFLRTVSDTPPPARLEAAARRFRSWTADRRALILLDDAASAAQVAPLLPNGKGCGTLVTSRRLLPGLPGAAVIRLGPLDPGDGFQLLALLAGEARVLKQPEAALELLELCDNLPLAIRVAAERLAARPLLGLPELTAALRAEEDRLGELRLGGLDVGARLREAGRRLERADRRALYRLALLGPSGFDLDQAAKTLSLDQRPAQRVLGRLLEASMLEETGSGPDDEWPWTARRYRVPTLIRLAWMDTDTFPHEPGRLAGPAGGRLPRCAADAGDAHSAVRLSRYRCVPGHGGHVHGD
ncbi:MAG TPA: BTAD domain-containing putative transcriptional regulator [Actinocrinis sp.]|nr:BTAD domain-containing putative transcriptional regulator [Actinocrinis sp.]